MSDQRFSSDSSDDRIPENWQWHQGPANWFRFRCPPEFHVRQEHALLEISHDRSQDRGTALQICTTWIGEQRGGSLSDSLLSDHDILSLFPDAIRSQQLTQPNAADRLKIRQGISRRPATGSIWNRWFQRRPLYQWKCWTRIDPPLMTVAVVQSAPGSALDEDFVAVCDQIMNSLELSENPAWPPNVFRDQVVDLARASFPLLKITRSGAFCIRVEDSEIHLHNFYRAYLLQPESFKRIVLPGITTVVRLRELSPEQMIPPLEIIRTEILPMLSAEGLQRADGLICIPWVAGLSVQFVIDEQDSYRFIHQQMLSTWQISTDQLHELALSNLRQYAATHPLEVTVVGDQDEPRLLMPTEPDAYNCVRLLDSQFHGRLRELFGPQLVIGVPNRDFFVAVSLNHPALIQEIQDRVRQDYVRMQYPLTERLLVISADGVSEYC